MSRKPQKPWFAIAYAQQFDTLHARCVIIFLGLGAWGAGSGFSSSESEAPKDVGVEREADSETLDGGATVETDGQTDAALSVDSSVMYVFVTSDSIPGTFASGKNALAEADAFCASVANSDKSRLPKMVSWRAWISTATLNAKAHLGAGGPWYLANGTPAFSAFADVTADFPSPMTAISVAEDGTTFSDSSQRVWTGSTASGIGITGKACNAWSESDPSKPGTAGDPTAKNATWSNFGTVPCAEQHHLYCFEQP